MAPVLEPVTALEATKREVLQKVEALLEHQRQRKGFGTSVQLTECASIALLGSFDDAALAAQRGSSLGRFRIPVAQDCVVPSRGEASFDARLAERERRVHFVAQRVGQRYERLVANEVEPIQVDLRELVHPGDRAVILA